MADAQGGADRASRSGGGAGPSRGPDAVSLVFGLLFLAVAGLGAIGTAWWLVPGLGPWTAAGVVAVIGLVMIISAIPGRRRRS